MNEYLGYKIRKSADLAVSSTAHNRDFKTYYTANCVLRVNGTWIDVHFSCRPSDAVPRGIFPYSTDPVLIPRWPV